MRATATIVLLLAAAAAAPGVVRFPPPQFHTDHRMPPTTTPPPGDRPRLYAFSPAIPFLGRYLDAVALSAVVSLGVYLALKRAPLHSLVALTGMLVLYLGLWDQACKRLVSLAGLPPGSGAERILSLATPLIVLAGVLVWAERKRSRHGIVLGLLLAGLAGCVWWDGVPGSWGMMRRVAWLAGAEDFRPRLPFALEWLDVALLGAAILAAAYLALRRRTRHGIIVLTVFCLLHFGFWRQGCICPIGAVQTVSQSLFDRSYPISPIVVLFFLLPLLGTVGLGRSFCAAVCPLGAIQDLVVVRPLRVPAWLGHVLGLLAWVYLGLAVLLAAVGSAFIICRYDPFVALFRLEGTLLMLLLGACFLVLGLFVARPYCRFLCPYGAVLRVLSAVSWRKVKLTPAECVHCDLCEDSCPFGAIRPRNADDPPRPRRGGRGPLVAMLLLAPVLVAGFGWLGGRLAAPLARTHQMVRLAERVAQEQQEKVVGETDATSALKAMEESARLKRYGEIRDEARSIQGKFAVGSWVFGGFIGLVLAMKLVALSVRRRREDYEADPATCLACGRCFAYCPIELQRRKERA